MDFNAIISRVMRVFMFDLTIFKEVEEDKTVTRQAWTVVVIAAVASGIGAAIGNLFAGLGFGRFVLALIFAPILSLIGYFLWAFVTYWVGVNMFQAQTDFEEMQRVIGFAYAPNVVGILSFIPCVGPLLSFVASIYALVLSVMAVKEGLDVDMGKAIVTCVIGWVVNLIVGFVIGGMLLGAGFGL